MNNKNIVNYIHWTAIISGMLASIATVAVGSNDVRIAGVAAVILSISQAVHKFADSLDHQDTLDKAVQASTTVKTL